MAKRALAWLGLLAAAASFGGCGKTGDGGAVERSELPAAVANVMCGSLGSCCKSSSFAFDEAACRRQQTAVLADELSRFDPKNVSYDAQAAGDCLAALAAHIECGRIDDSSANATCQKIFSGKLGLGEVCTDSMECARPAAGGSAFCETTPNDAVVKVCMQQAGSAGVHGKKGQSCNGSCEGDNCSIAAEPVPGDTATPTQPVLCYQSDGLYCSSSGVCEALLGRGQPCTDFASCTADLFCDLTTGACAAPLALGASCNSSYECQSHYCTDDTSRCAERTVTSAQCASAQLDN